MYLLKVKTERRNTMYNPLLKTFVYVVEMGSFSKAAQKMYITPASVMKQINFRRTSPHKISQSYTSWH